MKHGTQTTHDPSPLADWLPILGAGWFLVFCLYFFSFALPNAATETYRLDILRLVPEILKHDLFPASPQKPSGWRYLPQRIDLFAHAALILGAAFAVGRLVLRGLGVLQVCDRPARWAISGGIGLSLLSLWALFTGLAGALNWPLFVTFYLAAITVEIGLWLRGASKTLLSPREKPSLRAAKGDSHRSRFPVAVWLAVLAPFVGVMMLGAMLPSQDFDVKEYHLEGPKEYFLNGRITFLPDNVYTSFPFLTEMLSLSGMVLRGDWYRGALVGKLVLMSFAPLTALGAFSLARRIAGPRAGWLAALFYLSTPWAYRISIIAYAEGAFSCYAMLTLLALFVFNRTGANGAGVAHQIDHPEPKTEHGTADISPASAPRRRFGLTSLRAQAGDFLIGLLAGSAAATKYPGLVFVTVPAALALLTVRTRRAQRSAEGAGSALGAFGRTIVAFSLGVLITFGPWLAKNFLETGNPVYPLAYSIFGGADWNEVLNEKWKDAHDPPADRFTNARLLQDRLVDVVARSDWQSPLLFGFAPCAFLIAPSHRRAVALIAGYVLVFFSGWYSLTHHIDRFWIPMIPAVTVLAGIGASSLRDRLFQTVENFAPPLHLLPFTMSIAVGLLAATALVFNFAFMTTPSCGYNAYLLDEAVARRECTTPSIALLNGRIKPGQKVLFVGEAQVFDARFGYRYNTVFDFNLLEEWCVDSKRATSENRYPLLPADQIRQRLQQQGITHVFVNWNEILRYREPGSYGYTDFVSPRRMHELEQLGVLTSVPLDPAESLIPWQGLSQARRAEIDRWGPELKTVHFGIEAARAYDLYEVHPAAPDDVRGAE